MTVPIDPGMTFRAFVVGPENRLAWNAARIAAESPGTAYNPLFIYSATGMGKTHLLGAVSNRVRELNPRVRAIYTPLESLIRRLSDPAEARVDFRSADILLIDDLQFLGPEPESQRVFFHLLDNLLMSGKQVILACDRPPLELGGIDDRLVSRFSGGLVVDIGRPSLETRKTILERRLSHFGETLRPEVVDAIARVAIDNVRQLNGSLNRVIAAQKAQEREIEADEVDRLLSDVVSEGEMPWLSDEQRVSEFQEFVSKVSSAVEDAWGSPKWREDLARAILKWEGEGYVTKRLENFLDRDEPVDPEQVISAFERDIARLKAYTALLKELEATVPDEIALRDPDRVDELRDVVREARSETVMIDEFFLDSEKVVWTWPALEEQLIEGWEDGHQG